MYLLWLNNSSVILEAHVLYMLRGAYQHTKAAVLCSQGLLLPRVPDEIQQGLLFPGVASVWPIVSCQESRLALGKVNMVCMPSALSV